jgi:hypothetical protein
VKIKLIKLMGVLSIILLFSSPALAAGVAAKMAIDEKVIVQDIDTAALTATLRDQHAVMEWKRSLCT